MEHVVIHLGDENLGDVMIKRQERLAQVVRPER